MIRGGKIVKKDEKTSKGASDHANWLHGRASKSNYLKVLYTNADGFLNKKDELIGKLATDDKDIIAITELIPKWIKEFVKAEYKIPGYQLFKKEDPERGAALYIKDELNPKPEENLSEHNFKESIWCSIKRGEQKVLLGSVYRSPNSPQENNDTLIDLLGQGEI